MPEEEFPLPSPLPTATINQYDELYRVSSQIVATIIRMFGVDVETLTKSSSQIDMLQITSLLTQVGQGVVMGTLSKQAESISPLCQRANDLCNSIYGITYEEYLHRVADAVAPASAPPPKKTLKSFFIK